MNLNGNWNLYYYEHGTLDINHPSELKAGGAKCIKATVPGNTQLDLIKEGLLPKDIFKGENILETERLETYDWWYETEFVPTEAKANEMVYLHFGAVDCFAEYYLNGELIGMSDNAFIEQDFEVGEFLNYGEKNTLHVYIKSPIAVINETPMPCGVNYYSWHMFDPMALLVRKPAHEFGWDIMPRCVTSGIWRDVELQYRPIYGFESLYFVTHSINGNDAAVRLYYDAKVPLKYTSKKMKMKITGKCGDSEFSADTAVYGKAQIAMFNVKNVKLWWPKNYGEPDLYDVTVTLLGDDGEVICEEKVRQGFRTIKLERTETAVNGNGCFRFFVNNVPVMIVGSNWVPMDCFHSRDKLRYRKALELAVDCNCNMLRCWGGNVYEDHDFFDFCDENGILVWQDFGMACMFYPQTEEFFEKIRIEAESVVKKLRNHTSLAVWSGDNEIDMMVYSNGLAPSRNRITREIIPDVLMMNDPVRPYLPSSPYISDEVFKLGGSALVEDHLWGPRDYYKGEYYTDSNACFVSETGYHGAPSVESLKKMVDEEYLMPTPTNKQWILHSSDQKGGNGRVMLMINQIRQLFGLEPDNLEDFVCASQISQAEANKFFVERARMKMDYMGGIIWWNLIDGWPQMSDAVVDYYYDKKLSYYYLKRSMRPFAVMMGEIETGGYPIVAANSTRNAVSGRLTVTDCETGAVMYDGDFSAGANCNTCLGKINIPHSQKGMLILKWETEDGKFFNNYLYGTPGFDFEAYKRWQKCFEEVERNV